MRTIVKFAAVSGFSVAVVAAALAALTDPAIVKSVEAYVTGAGKGSTESPIEAPKTTGGTVTASPPAGYTIPLFTTGGFETGGFGTANRFTGPIVDRGSIEEVCEALASRVPRGIEACMEELRSIPTDEPGASVRKIRADGSIILLLMYQGKFDDAAIWAERALADAAGPGIPAHLRANLTALLGVIHLRRGETENCLDCIGPSSCIFPIAPEAVHRKTSGSRTAVRYFSEYLRQRPDDNGVRWLRNVASMTLGEYPDQIPAEWRFPLDRFPSTLSIGRFENVATAAGLGVRGANMAGGSAFDDFTGDGLPDVLTTSLDLDLGAGLFVNRGDGTFEDRSARSGLKAQPYAVNGSVADYDNDGRLDVMLVRGGWENAARLSLLRNKGDGVFEDVTVAAGLGAPIASHSASWGDYDNDGHLDIYVCGEYASAPSDGFFSENSVMVAAGMNRCRLYHNRGDGTFQDVAESAGVSNDRYAKAAVWGDFDNDGLLDIYVSNCGQQNRLYHNRGDGTFVDLAPRLGVTEPIASFSCGAFDYDNDGRLDIFVTDYASGVNGWATSALGKPVGEVSHPRLFRNMGAAGFKDVAPDVGLDRVVLAMGLGVGDVDNDGFLDVYLGTGRPDYSALMPNVLYKNVEGRRFEDVTVTSGTGHLQKGHGVSFADWDCDGDLDMLVEVGGGVPGDKANNLLFQNPGQGWHWLKVRLVGTRTNRAALGAKLRVDLKRPDGTTRSIHRTIGNTSSYGNSSLVEHIGLGDASSIASLTVSWPVGPTTQTFHDLSPDTLVEISEGSDSPRVVKQPALPAPPH